MEFKFRYYDKKSKKLTYPGSDGWFEKSYKHKNGVMQTVQLGVLVNRHNDGLGILEMFTGLTDKNKNPIYEGDEIIMNNLAKGFIKYANGSWLIEWYDDSYSDLLGWANWARGIARGENALEITGSIHDKN